MGPQLVRDERFRYLVWEGKRLPAAVRARIATHRSELSLDDPPMAEAMSADEAKLVKAVLERAGIDPRGYRSKPFCRRIPACLRALEASTAAGALEAIERNPLLYSVALDVLVNATTSMFRDGAVFSALRTMVAPDLAHRGRARVLSVGCSSGAELASVAILLDLAGALDSAELHGIDCRAGAINGARRGVFTAREIAAVPAWIRGRYLSPAPGGWSLPASIRARLNFHCVDALGPDLPAGPWDLILCRNVAIYLGRNVACDLWRRLSKVLSPAGGGGSQRERGGYLVVGHAERVPAECGLSRRVICVYQRERN